MASEERTLTIREWCGVERPVLADFIERLRESCLREGEPPIVLRDEVRRTFRQFLLAHPKEDRRRLRDTLGGRIAQTEEVIFNGKGACIVLREKPGNRGAYLTHGEEDVLEQMEERAFLSFRESILLHRPVAERFTFGVDFRPYRVLPEEGGTAEDIGNGPQRVGTFLEKGFRADPQAFIGRFLDFLSGRSANGGPLFFVRRPSDIPSLRKLLHQAIEFLQGRPATEAIDRVQPDLEILGFARGWGATTGRTCETLLLLQKLILDPRSEDFQTLLHRLPLMRSVLLVSVHGWFAQDNVLGRPDTGGQVVYVLDQARALEAFLTRLWREAGVEVSPRVIALSRLIPEAEGTTCNERLELIWGSQDSWILRVPFRDRDGGEVPQWISRFQVWPYLERYAQESYGEVMSLLDGRAPDLVIGNYSDGNTVASMLGREWNVPISVIAHALEKSKYLLSDLYWRDMEPEYHFSIQFLSDILATNSADFIQTSTYQEIAGASGELGQYESLEVFTLPERYRVLSGVNIQSARFTINPPGVDMEKYHVHTDERPEDRTVEEHIEELVYGETPEELGVVGRFADPTKPLIFSMARLDKIKNLTGLLHAFGRRPALRDAANILLVSGSTQLDESKDLEEREQIRHMMHLYEQHDLWSQVRWLPSKLGQGEFPHYYRFVAKRRGLFIQPALFEAFGLTVLEAMACGLPVVATKFGGPSTIIEDGVSGFLVDPNRPLEVEKACLAILCGTSDAGEDLWPTLSHASVRRVLEHFSWDGHARRLVSNHGVYGLWNHVSPKLREVRASYVGAIHHLLFQELIRETWPDLA